MDQPPLKESRAPINLRIKFRSESIDQFIERYSIDVSRGGIFIRTREPLAVGTQLKFDFQLQDSSPLMAGEGTVVWIREYDANRTGITPGMGVRFDKLTPASQPVLEKILAEKGRRDHANSAAPSSGGIMSKVGAGMAVRRPSSTFTALDPRAVGLSSSPQPVAPTETPPSGLNSAARRERRGSPQAPAKADQPGSSPTVERTNQGFGPTAASPIERTSLGGFSAPSGPGHPMPMTLPNAVSQRPRTPGALPTLESTGSARAAAGADVSSLVSRLTSSRPSTYEPPTSADIDKALDGLTPGSGTAVGARPPVSAKAPAAMPSADQGIPSVDEDDSVSEPTKTGDALAEYFGAIPTAAGGAPELAAAATSASLDGVAVPLPTSDSDRTVATPLEKIEEALANEATELAKEATALQKTGKELGTHQPIISGALPTTLAPTSTPDTPPPELKPATPALVLIRNESGPVVKKDDAAPFFGGEDKHTADEPTPVVDGSSPWSMSPPAPAEVAAAPSNLVTEAGRPMSAAGVVMTSAVPVAKGGTARPAGPARKSPVPLVVVGLVAVAAVIAVVAFQQSAGDHSQEAFKQPSSVPAAPPSAAASAQEPATAPAVAPAATPPATAPAAAAPPAPEATKVAEAFKPAEVPVAVETPPATRSAEAAPPSVVRVERGAGGAAKAVPVPARKSAVASASSKRAAAAAAAAAAAPTAVATESAPPPSSAPAAAPDQVEPGADLTVAPPKLGVQRLLKVTSTPAGAEVLIDGQSVGKTPFQGNDIDADAPHAVTIKLDGYETHEHMINASDWQKAKGNQETARIAVKLRKMSGPGGASDVSKDMAKKSEAAGAGEPARSEAEPRTEPRAPEKASEPPAPEPKQKDEAANAAPGK